MVLLLIGREVASFANQSQSEEKEIRAVLYKQFFGILKSLY